MQDKFTFKICLLGEPEVGKTTLVYRYIHNKFTEELASTLGVNILRKNVELEGYYKITVQIWDLGGQDFYKFLRNDYLKGGMGALVIFDLTRKNTFSKVHEWIKDFYTICGSQPILLVGSKNDLTEKIEVDYDQAELLAKNNDMNFIVTSAKSGENVENAFTELIEEILHRSRKINDH